jgi:hypothetical protein
MIQIPADLTSVLDVAWGRAKNAPGSVLENEARFLGIAAACTPADGAIVEIGNGEGRSTVMLATVAGRYGRGPVVWIPSDGLNNEGFLSSLRKAGVEQQVELQHGCVKEVSASWSWPIRFLWMNGDRSLKGAREAFEAFSRFLGEGGVVAISGSLEAFAGPVGVFVDCILRSSKFGPAGFVHSIAWAQYRPKDGSRFDADRRGLYRQAVKLLPYLKDGVPLKGVSKAMYQVIRSRVPRATVSAEAWATMLEA